MIMHILSLLVHFVDLKHFLLWVVVPVVSSACTWGLRRLVGVDRLEGRFSSSLQALLDPSATSLGPWNMLHWSLTDVRVLQAWVSEMSG